ncbi:uncharacterized protein ighd [Pseudorasbora parva]|uniref:uncharacterized protein ighd n=1 Tax=Pseudorasbora parva TaxID=51549 RepID=UPI00351ED9D0
MVSSPANGSLNLEHLRQSEGGSLPLRRQHSLPNIFLQTQGRPGPCLAQSPAICFPPDRDAAANHQENLGDSIHGAFDSPALEEPNVVLRSDPAVRHSPIAHSAEERPPHAGEGEDLASQSRAMGPPHMAHLVSGNLSDRVMNTISEARAPATRRLYTLKWSVFSNWCAVRNIDARSCETAEVLAFLKELLDAGRSPSTLKVYVAAIAANHAQIAGHSLGKNELIVRFLKGARRLNPPCPPSVPIWDLAVVLEAMKGPPFEPLQTATIKLLSLKTAFLLALASVKRVSDLHALSVSPSCLEFGPNNSKVVLKLRHDFIPKVLSTPFRAQVITLLPLPTSQGEQDANLLCPVRALRLYLERSSPFRQSDRLFVCFGGRTKGTSHCVDYFDYWGKGTKVTVSSAQESAPRSIFALSQCSAGSDGLITIGCLTRGFSPADSLTFSWTDGNGKTLTDVVQYPALGGEGDYTKFSHLRVKKSDWDSKKPYTCEASNSRGNKKTTVSPPVKRVTPPTIALLSREDGNNIVLQCQLKDYYPEQLTVQWFRGDQRVNAADKTILQTTEKVDNNFTYISQISISAPYEDKPYTCKATHNTFEFKKEYNMCMEKSVFKPSIQVKKVNLRDNLEASEVTFSCIVEAPYSTEVSWLPITAKKNVSPHTDQHNKIVSNWTLSRNEWLKLETIVCTAKHPCFPDEKVEIQAGKIKKDPVVVIRRAFKKSGQTDSALLECVVNDLPSGEVCVNFQVNHSSISDVKCVDWTPSESIWSLTTHFSIPSQHQKEGNTFTCTVHRLLQRWTSEPTGNIFVKRVTPPTIALLSREDGNNIVLQCQLKDYYPEQLTVQWFRGDQRVNAADKTILQTTEKVNNNFTYISQISISAPYEDKPYTCKATHNTFEFKKEYNMCMEKSVFKPSIQVKKVNLRDNLEASEVTFSCIVEAPYSTEVSWLPITAKKNVSPHTDQHNKIVSNWTLSRNEWLKLETIVCTAKHPCFPDEKVEIQAGKIKKDPVVVIRRAFKKSGQTDSALLECVVNDLPSGEVCVNFQVNHSSISDVKCVDWTPSESIWSLTTHFSIPSQHQKEGNTFTCTVHRLLQSWTSEPTGNIFVKRVTPPTIALLSREDGNNIVLQCQLKDYYPEQLTVQWFRGDQRVNAADKTILQTTDKVNNNFTYISQISISAQYEDKPYTCKATHNTFEFKKEYNMCMEKSVFKPSIQVKKVNLRDNLEASEVTFSCIVEAPYSTEVSWLPITAKKNSSPHTDQHNKIVSNWTLSRNEWLKLETIVCTAKHPCFPDEKVEIQAGNIKNPVVVIRRAFKKSGQTDSALLECVVNDLPSGEVCVNFQVNHSSISDVKCVDWTPSESIWSLTTHFSIPSQHQKEGNTFTCTVHRLLQSWTSEPTGNIFDDPTIELLVVSSVGQSNSKTQKLLCSGKGFDPKIKWIPKSYDKTGTALGTMMEDGRVKVYSEILVPQQEWEKGVTYTCEIDDGRNVKTTANTSICAVIAPSSQKAAVYLLGSSLNPVRPDKDVYLTCLVFGQSVKHFSIQWKKNGVNLSGSEQAHKDHANGTQSKTSILKISTQTWNKYVFTCEVKHMCSNFIQQQNISKTKDPKKPTVRIFRPSDSDLSGHQNTSLLCFITGFYPSDISVQWQLNGMQLDASHFIDSPVVAHTSGSFSMHSALILPASQQKDGMYSCIVFHESSRRPFNASLQNLYASLIHSAPSTKLLQHANELVCLAYGFSPSAINITWLREMTEVNVHNETKLAKDTDGKFSIQSHLQLPSDWAPGEVYRCRITHVTGTLLLNVSKNSAVFEEAIFMNENKAEFVAQDTVEESWNMACAFLTLFLLSLLYGCTVTLVKVKPN